MRPVGPRLVSLVIACGVAACNPDERRFVEGPPAPPERVSVDVAFDPAATLFMGVGQSAALSVVVTPSPPSPLYVALRGDAADASLDRGVVSLGADGRGTVRLFAPSRAASFEVVASVDGAGAGVRSVTVSGGGTASLVVLPQYAGKRSLGEISLSARPGERCSDHASASIPDGTPMATGPLGAPTELAGIPIGSTALVSARAGELAAGCVDVGGLHLGETRMVIVNLVDAPMRIAPMKLHLSLKVVPDEEAWPLALSVAKARFVDALFGSTGQLSAALLDTMGASLTPASAALFSARRASLGWDAAISSLVAPAQALGSEWVPSGVTRLVVQPGVVAGTLSSDPASPGFAVLVPDDLLGVTGASLSPDPKKLTWALAAEGTDKVALGGAIVLPLSRVLAASVDASLAAAGAKSGSDALVEAMHCDAVAAAMSGGGQAFGACGAPCVVSLCEAASRAMWERAAASDESAGRSLSLAFTLSASAEVDDEAQLVSMQGSWTGVMTESGPSPLAPKIPAKGPAFGGP